MSGTLLMEKEKVQEHTITEMVGTGKENGTEMCSLGRAGTMMGPK